MTRPSPRPSRRHVLAGAAALVISAKATTAAAAGHSPAHSPGQIADHLTAAAHTSGVPREVLLALAFSVSRLNHRDGRASASGGHGVMALTRNDSVDTLGTAAGLTGLGEHELITSQAANIAGGAALLRAHADAAGLDATDRSGLDAWYEPLARYAQHHDDAVARLEADEVYRLLAEGARSVDGTLVIQPHAVFPELRAFGEVTSPTDIGTASTDYGPAHWVQAHSNGYRVASRPGSHAIDRVIVHTMQGYYAGSISWFQNPSAGVAAHYLIRSSDGDVTQMVRNKDIGWHANSYNNRSIGIEHEGFVDDPAWYTAAMYESSAALTRHLCDTYGLPKNRTTIIGHHQVPDATHTDPGPHWDWTRYLNLVTGGGSGWSVTIDNSTSGAFTASSNWTTGNASGQYGSNHRHAQPVLSSDPAWFKATLPRNARYRVDVWYPDDPANNSAAPYVVAARGGNRTVYVDQRTNGGGWRSIGTFDMDAGTRNVAGVSRWTSSPGWIEADAVRLTEV